MSKTNITKITDSITVARDAYRSKYTELSEKHNNDLKFLKDNYVNNSQQYKVQKELIQRNFKDDVEKARTDAVEFVLTQINELREQEVTRVGKIDADIMQKISSIADIPITAEELGILKEKYNSDNENYWASRLLANIAEKNGIPASQIYNSASISVKLDILGQLEQRTMDFLNKYDGSPSYDINALISDNVLMRSERIYCNGYENAPLEDEQTARRAFVMLKDQNPVSQGIGIRNILNNASDTIKNAFFYQLSNSSDISEYALKWSGYEDEYKAFINGTINSYREAIIALETARNVSNKDDFDSIVGTMTDNPYFNDMLQRESKVNSVISSFTEESEPEIQA